ncbi:protoglobin domain-containing protein [Phenylobacterium sp.]|uniref:protoglobin domain-containing protein n=1 Tax=Phenylobacterium sp. TaxID=1871053 RepID=UPI0027240F30|nr:protoglobin domain-containing protein [Phenylobacterium sp.]MDO8379355.1 protoglobin domain-containing protein [Phenylobacterium sp.]
MDDAARMTDRAMKLAERVDIDGRLARFQIDGSTQTNLRQFKLLRSGGLDPVISRFYEYVHRFPETQAMLKGHDEDRLRQRQKEHWRRLLSCEFDRSYVHSCLLVGLAHYHARVSPHTYMAAYSFFQAELLRSAMKLHTPAEMEALSISIGKVIMLDMSIALNAYILDAVSMKP